MLSLVGRLQPSMSSLPALPASVDSDSEPCNARPHSVGQPVQLPPAVESESDEEKPASTRTGGSRTVLHRPAVGTRALDCQLPPAVGCDVDDGEPPFKRQAVILSRGASGSQTGLRRPAVRPDFEDHVMEVFCPPRLVPAARTRGLSGQFSLDKDGSPVWDANGEHGRRQAFDCLRASKPLFLLLSPECRMYSILQRNCNLAKMDPVKVKLQQEEADQHVHLCCQLIDEQCASGRFFLMEQPASASSWQLPCLQRIQASRPDIKLITFPQCRFGLRDLEGRPLQKHTGFLTNLSTVVERFAGLKCICSLRGETHGRIEGTQQGVRLSRWAQSYPPELVQALVTCVQEVAARY